MNKEYAGLPFAVGTITGIRSWSVDTLGRLVGNYGQIWRPGENVARCPSDCAGVEESCTCGFYAYHKNDHVYGEAVGVIEGYGTVVIGTTGFRCSKARIIGIYVNKDDRAHVERNYPDLSYVDKRKRVGELLRGEGLPSPESMGDEFWTLGAKPLQKPSTGFAGAAWPSIPWGNLSSQNIQWSYDAGGSLTARVYASPATPDEDDADD